ncbi:MAG: hypothetical protein E7621_06380 [Ruminococcaceae bacterium]|nr:hypothetical protein [Oscillospiraceae bacterium]
MKKAVILAGGKGTRLSPITDNIPKPLVPFIGKTVIERILDKLKDAGVEDVLISTMHMSDKIKEKLGENYCGIRIKYLVEQIPLGTAGGMKFAKRALSVSDCEDILVMSGDCVCDFDLKKVFEHHKNAKCDATIVTVECDEPLEYGIVLSNKEGLIKGFNEKPAWSQVNCSSVNTGIYILNSSVIDDIPESFYDFSKDLFPEMLKKEKNISHFKASGYWCDIGSPESYFKCLIDGLEGKIKNLNTSIKDSVYVHEDTKIGENVSIGPNVSIESGCIIEKNSAIAGSIIHEDVTIGEGCRIEGAVLLKGAKIGSHSHIEGGVIIGSGLCISDKSKIKAGTVISSKGESLKHYDSGDIFDHEDGIILSGSEMCVHLGETVAYTVGSGGRIGIMYEKNDICRAYSSSLISGLENSSCHIIDFGEGFENLARFASVFYSTDCFLYVNENDGKIYTSLFNRNGLPPSHEFERKLKNNYRKNITVVKKEENTATKVSAETLYFCSVTDNFKAYLTNDLFCGTTICFSYDDACKKEGEMLKKAFKNLCGETCDIKTAQEEIKYAVNISADREIYVSQGNYTLDSHHMKAALIAAEKRLGKTSFALPFLCPECFTDILSDENVFRYPMNSSYRVKFPKNTVSDNLWLNDNILLSARFISYVFSQKINLSELSRKLPVFSYTQRYVKIPKGISKTFVIKNLASEAENIPLRDSYEGIVIRYPKGKVTVVPGKSAVFKLYAEAANSEIAQSLCEQTEKKMFEK